MAYTAADFTPAAGLSNNHLMTLAPLWLPRRFPLTDRGGQKVFIEVEPGNQVLVKKPEPKKTPEPKSTTTPKMTPAPMPAPTAT